MKNKILCFSFASCILLSFGFTQAHAANETQDNSAIVGSTGDINQAQSGVDQAGQNKETGDKFMGINKNKANVVTLPSGLEYEVLEKGAGKKPGKNDTVTVDYEGKLLNGTVFDSSYKRGQPATFPVNGVIAGWQEALQLMNEGDTWMLYIPSDLAYGKTGAGGIIGPNETLVFKVHLIKVQ